MQVEIPDEYFQECQICHQKFQEGWDGKLWFKIVNGKPVIKTACIGCEANFIFNMMHVHEQQHVQGNVQPVAPQPPADEQPKPQ